MKARKNIAGTRHRPALFAFKQRPCTMSDAFALLCLSALLDHGLPLEDSLHDRLRSAGPDLHGALSRLSLPELLEVQREVEHRVADPRHDPVVAEEVRRLLNTILAEKNAAPPASQHRSKPQPT